MVIESGELSPNTARLTACRASDIVVVGEKGGFKFLYAYYVIIIKNVILDGRFLPCKNLFWLSPRHLASLVQSQHLQFAMETQLVRLGIGLLTSRSTIAKQSSLKQEQRIRYEIVSLLVLVISCKTV